jgi:hypothetical protein
VAINIFGALMTPNAPWFQSLCVALLRGNQLGPLFDCLALYLGRLISKGEDKLFIPLANALAVVLSELVFSQADEVYAQWIVDITSYVIVVHVVDYLQSYFSHFVSPSPEPTPAVLPAINLLLALVHQPHYSPKADKARLLATLRETDIAGVVPLLYAVLFHPNASKAASELPVTTQSVVYIGLKILNYVGFMT